MIVRESFRDPVNNAVEWFLKELSIYEHKISFRNTALKNLLLVYINEI